MLCTMEESRSAGIGVTEPLPECQIKTVHTHRNSFYMYGLLVSRQNSVATCNGDNCHCLHRSLSPANPKIAS